MTPSYKIIFSGKLAPGADPGAVRVALRGRCGLPSVVVKVLDDESKAKTYEQALVGLGLDCRAIPLSAQAPKRGEVKRAPPHAPAQVPRPPARLGVGAEPQVNSSGGAFGWESPGPPTPARCQPSLPESAPIVREQRVIEIREPGAYSTRQIVGLLGSILLIIGVFSPVVSLPMLASISYVANGQGDGVFVLMAGLISLVAALARRYRILYWTGGIGLAVMIFTLSAFSYRMAEVKGDMERDLAGNPFRGLADAAISAVQLQWGWSLLIAGAILLLVSAGGKGK